MSFAPEKQESSAPETPLDEFAPLGWSLDTIYAVAATLAATEHFAPHELTQGERVLLGRCRRELLDMYGVVAP